MNQNFQPTIEAELAKVHKVLSDNLPQLWASLTLDAQDVGVLPATFAAGLIKQCIRKGATLDAAVIAVTLHTIVTLENEANARNNSQGQPSAEAVDHRVEPESSGGGVGAPVGDGSGDENRPGLSD